MTRFNLGPTTRYFRVNEWLNDIGQVKCHEYKSIEAISSIYIINYYFLPVRKYIIHNK